ncbi:DUF72 domain-containing protein [Nocardia fluminea]|uniref:DUF72 domain-containing protein n=1 Tax=Nocardia fluminea TaxID=134984 RepID=UPI00343EAB20
MTMYVGTSGWQYRDWRGELYPPGLPVRRWLEHYAGAFATVESNNAFYRLPSRENFAGWRERTPADFVMAVKASRYLTHIKRLRDPAEPVQRLLDRTEGLGDRLGPILLQLPPTLRADPELLDNCLRCFPDTVRVAVEPRHDSWWTDETRDVLRSRGAALTWADRDSRPITPLWRTTDWAYLRLHAGRATPPPSYGKQALNHWAHRLLDTWPPDSDSYVYFNNDHGGAAVRDAVTFAHLAAGAGGDVTRVPDLSSRERTAS